MDSPVVRIQPVTPSSYAVKQAGDRNARKDSPPFDLEKEAKGQGKRPAPEIVPAGEVELPEVAPANEGEAGTSLDIVG